MAQNEMTFLDLFYLLFQKRRQFILTLFIVAVLSAGLSMIVPRWYSASTTLLPPSEDGADFGISSLLSNLPVGGMGLGLGLGTLSDETNMYLAILNSRTVLQSVVDEFNLQQRYKTKTMQETRKALAKRMTIEINEDNTISLSIHVRTPYFCRKKDIGEASQLSMRIANYFIQELDRVNKKLKLEKAKNNRLFIEKRYKQNLDELASAEEAFQAFQKKYGMISLEEQTKAIITTMAGLKAQIIAKEVQVGAMSLDKAPSHPDVKREEYELEELRQVYSDLKRAEDEKVLHSQDYKNSDIFIPIGNVPELGMDYLRLFREVKIQEMLQEFLYPQYEQARIQEAKDTPTIQVLDAAAAPELKSKPKRIVMVAVAVLAAFFIMALLIIMNAQLARLAVTNKEQYDKIQEIRSNVRTDLFFWKKNK